MDTETAQTDDLRLVALQSAVNCTDMFVRFTLSEWSLRPLTDDATAAATRLVSAVVEHSDSQSPGFVSVRLRIHGNNLVIEVEDDQGVLPPAVSSNLAGVHTGVISPEGRGRIVWCELELPEGMRASDVPLPRRDPKRSQSAEQSDDVPDDVDPQVMERLLSGLSRRAPDSDSQ
ncbi:hypothetical protein SAMN04487905_103114 [Actinopolyspora xinjiangensis]|uniref:Histidine kinase-like ATPase domain-containing protein n=1 Tax=Actinopolyspora xinjiangensis TaxID=405564 RepID=A0A1H0RKF2_9ACTN|nr:hypothetical protein [Actinopolyspora xinjiangensis]SDP30003.1 hypothetical protein SAMN04487905_103114 [Actinopolyspora xinjiangensis]